MKRGRVEKLMEPMFPRLNVNDTYKGGPRAPPRNKMALYEQLSIPSQRYHSPILPKPMIPATSVAPQSGQVPSRHHHNEDQYYPSSDSGASLAEVEQRKKHDEDDYSVPIFINTTSSQHLEKNGVLDFERGSASNPHHKNRDDENKKRNILKGPVLGCVDNIPSSSPIFKNECLRPQIVSVTSRRRSNMDDTIGHLVCLDNVAAMGNINSSTLEKYSPQQNQNSIDEMSNNVASLEDGSCKSFQTGNMERDDSISETSVLDAESGLESVTPDDVVSLIGQKRFWKARKTIANQQRIFAVQVFELHKLIKVQKSVAASPHLLLEDTAASKPVKSFLEKKAPLDSPVETVSNVSRENVATELISNCKEVDMENSLEKASLSASENIELPSKCKPLSGTSPICSNNPVYINQMQGHHQFLIPVMSPSEGLVYKPYPGPGFPGQACGACGSPGPNQTMNNFMCGVHAPPHCPMPFSPIGPYGYFPTYGMPMINTAGFPNSANNQMFQSHVPSQDSKAVPEVPKSGRLEDTEVLASTASSPSEKAWSSRSSSEIRSMLPFFPGYPAINASKQELQVSVPEHRPIKVVPHNSISASESAVRIFRSIQEERKQHDSV